MCSAALLLLARYDVYENFRSWEEQEKLLTLTFNEKATFFHAPLKKKRKKKKRKRKKRLAVDEVKSSDRDVWR